MIQGHFVTLPALFNQLSGPLVQLRGHLGRLVRGTTKFGQRFGKFIEFHGYRYFFRIGLSSLTVFLGQSLRWVMIANLRASWQG